MNCYSGGDLRKTLCWRSPEGLRNWNFQKVLRAEDRDLLEIRARNVSVTHTLPSNLGSQKTRGSLYRT